jgi:hypothetical protein
MIWLILKMKEIGWRTISSFLFIIIFLIYLYHIIRPSEDKSLIADNLYITTKTAIKENQLRARLQKENLGNIRKIYQQKIDKVKEIEDRSKRLEKLVELYEEIDSE